MHHSTLALLNNQMYYITISLCFMKFWWKSSAFSLLCVVIKLYIFISKIYQTQSPKFLLDDKVFKYYGIHEAIFIINLADVAKNFLFFFHSFRNTAAGNFDLPVWTQGYILSCLFHLFNKCLLLLNQYINCTYRSDECL